MYKNCFKRIIDFCLSFFGILILSPLFIALIIVGTINMKGNPFFVQERPGKNERIFKLIKFRTMTQEKDENGVLLPDDKRLTKYGKFLRKTSLDEIPELFNILIGDMAIVGPRPLLVRYLDRYDAFQHHRHDVRPGLTGYAQVHGRNALAWDDKFKLDVWYTENVSFKTDIKVFIDTIKVVLKRDGINSATSETMEEFVGSEKK